MDAKSAGREQASFSNGNSREGWEEWMMWDDPIDGALPESPQGQGLPRAKEGTVPSRKRKSRADDQAESQTPNALSEKRPVTARSHNVVERRYRSNINAKIADLRDSVPSLRSMADATLKQSQSLDASKATILSTAVAYIHGLERDKKRLETELSRVQARLEKLEQQDDEVISKSEAANSPAATTPVSVTQQATNDASTSSSWENPAQGMIQVPEDMRRLRTASIQAQYAEQPYIAYDGVEHESQSTIRMGEGGGRRARQIGKVMAGSLAGLMVMQGFGEKDPGDEKHSKRSLSTLTDQSSWAQFGPIPVLNLFQLSDRNVQYALIILRALTVLFVLGLCVFIYAFCYKPKSRKQDQARHAVSIPSLASPLEVRRNAWLTAIQTVRVPRHEMFPEWVAVNLEALHYVVRQAVGWHGYSRMTGQDEDDELARVRAWDIAIDAQLMVTTHYMVQSRKKWIFRTMQFETSHLLVYDADDTFTVGGDAEISGSRLILTILASGTLPKTPARLMLKALHLRVLLWKASKQREGSFWSIVQRMAAFLASQQWRLAQDRQRAPQHTDSQLLSDAESLPEHLTALLQLSCGEVLTDPIIQRAYNLAWSRPNGEDLIHIDPETDLVVEDSTIRSPLDAICAWLSSSTLQKALFASLTETDDALPELEWNFGVALHTAPRASIAQARALAANAVFVNTNRQSALSLLSQDFPSTAAPGHINPATESSISALFVDSSIPESIGYDVTLATYCALALSKLEESEVETAAVGEALELVSLGYQNVNDLTWLSFAAAHRLIRTQMRKGNVPQQNARLVGQIIPILLRWVESLEKSEGGLREYDFDTRRDVQRAIDDITRYMSELQHNNSAPTQSTSRGVAACATIDPKPSKTAEAPAQVFKLASLPDNPNTRRFSRASGDSGYVSGVA